MNDVRKYLFDQVFTQKSTPSLFNPDPLYIPPPKLIDALDIDSLDEECAKSKNIIDEARKALGEMNDVQRKRKKAHFYVSKVMRMVSSINILDNDIIVKRLGYRRALNVNRRKVIEQVLRALSLTHDMFTGICEKSSITSLSDQIGVTTYGNKRYGRYEDEQLPANNLAGKKRSISRMSRAIKMLKQLGLIEVHYAFDSVTGKNLPAIIRLTEDFFKVFMVSNEFRDAARFAKARQELIKTKHYSLPTAPEEIAKYTKERIEILKQERQRFATLQRKRKYLRNMSKTDIRDLARNEIKRSMTEGEFDRMSDQAYQYRVTQRYKELHKLRFDFSEEDRWASSMHPPPLFN